MTIAVIGDAMIDLYVNGSFGRVSPEWGMPIFTGGAGVLLPGGAANVAWEMVKHNQQVELTCLNDLSAVEVFERHGITCNTVGEPIKLPVKTRFFHDGIPVMMRWDVETKPEPQNFAFTSTATVCILCDYNKGFFSDSFGLPSDCITIADSKVGRFVGATVYKLNAKEAAHQTGTSDLKEASRIIRDRSQAKYVVITNGDQGFHLFDGHVHGRTNPNAFETVCVKNIVGAGDAFTAHLAIGLASGNDIETACKQANVKARDYVTQPRGVE
ncbi:MAG: PfkB family carbohydrate kinase [Planctomycetaceae bacterium]